MRLSTFSALRRDLEHYILENTHPWGGGISADVIWRKNMKDKEKKGENAKDKGRKGKEKGRKGKENEKRKSKRTK